MGDGRDLRFWVMILRLLVSSCLLVRGFAMNIQVEWRVVSMAALIVVLIFIYTNMYTYMYTNMCMYV